jgi:hypothetical protein
LEEEHTAENLSKSLKNHFAPLAQLDRASDFCGLKRLCFN